MIELFFYMVVAHCFFDYAGQGDFMANAKNKSKQFEGVPYYQPLTAHALMQSAPVYFLTGFWFLAVAEFVVHWITDYYKCAGKISYNADQLIHVICKAIWAITTIYLLNKA